MTAIHGIGRRKTSIAQVLLMPGEQTQLINGRPLTDYFPTVAMQRAAQAPLVLTNQVAEFGIKAKVQGGGKNSQADAVRLAVARALLEVDEKWRKQLKDAGMLTRDPRMKERKKFGLKGARRAPQFSKR